MEDEKKDTTTEGEAPNWEHTREFKINKLTRDLIRQTIDVTEAELASLRRRLEKLTYGA
jgi:hypothetical protein